MTKKILVSYDFSQNEIQNVRVQNLAADPTSPVDGQIWFNTTTGKLMVRQGGVNVDVTARANHSGTQLASTISDLLPTVQALRLNQFSAPNGAVSMGGQNVTNVGFPTSTFDAANKGYVDAAVNGTDWKQSARVATTTNITLSGFQTIDGITLQEGNRVLVKDQADATQNGIWVATSGAWYRPYDADTANKVTPGMSLMVEEGVTYASTQWRVITTGDIQVGTNAIQFAQIGAGTTYTAGNGINISGNTVSVDTSIVARKVVATYNHTFTPNPVINHNLNTLDVQVQMYEEATGETVDCDIARTNANTITLNPTIPVNGLSYRVVIIG